MHDVARLAGVSVKTVSNVVNGYAYLRPATKSRVEAAIAELGYQVNVSARNLRQGRTGMIGLAVPELSQPYFAELADLVIQAGEECGVTVLIEQTGAQRDRELEVLHGNRRRMTDGLIFSPLALGEEDRAEFTVGYPLVLLGERIFRGPTDHVTMANAEAAYAATTYLIGLGRRRIAVVGAHPGETVGSAALRTAGYERALAEAGLPLDPALVVPGDPWHRATGARVVEDLLASGTAIDAVFALNDALALGALRALSARGVRVPQDVAVIGFDDVDDARYSTPSLSSVAPGRREIARTAVELLVARIADPSPVRPFVEVVSAFTLVERESTRQA
ncbi:LacI family DNA-binding transcriptional regulator [Pengzhenrongella sicca]|uniref:LacI family DNA-binding transcriptional regulator n=2 Tax=Pengzhenrongella sicca TaxID=2819238 RepID=A0A8A4ZJS8_9MICO|nr:LacI family DNA-binding transcriptional regulator [Pengzhenrongella sicca]